MYVIALSGLAFVAVWALSDDRASVGAWVFLAVGVPLIVIGLLVARLTVEVDDVAVTATFGWGWPRRRVELTHVERVALVRNRWWNGWGIRKVRGGWMFNNDGRDAIELTLRSGRVFRIGTDQPAELSAAIERAHTA
jgi:hypothetical protein